MRKRAVRDKTRGEYPDDFNPFHGGGLNFCPRCFHGDKGNYKCIKCGEETIQIRSLRVRPPRQKASKMRWKEFFETWLPNVNFNNAWERRKLYLRTR